MMRAVVAPAYGGADVLEVTEIPEPVPGPGEVTIRVSSAGINFSDILALSGRYPGPPPPFVPGIEIAGTEVSTGRPVIALLDGGGYADVAAADSRITFDAHGLDLTRAGGFGLTTLAAYFGLTRAARLERGETVLVLAAAGGLGSAALQVARALGAAQVIAVASTPEKQKLALDLGADAAFGYEAALPPVDVVVDGVGGNAFASAYRAVRRFGRVLVLGASSGTPPPFPPFQELRERSVAITPFSFKALRTAEPEYVAQATPAALDLIRSGEINPLVGEAFPLEHATKALARLGSRETVGKLLLTP
jgi:NADPH2:quinone reductase